uniref:Integrase catalytic domain-containing protein n=1 Tax=Tanacetum cinerariifolium TaxID=118510 RepID=A0A6L2NEB5_TANCI|nr:hypothetical protein [Tanacetum cinerariifolium]
MLDQNFDRHKKLMSQLELLKEKLSQEDVNKKLLRNLLPEWNTHVVMWRNNADLDTMSMDDLYNKLKAVEMPNYALMVFSSSSSNSEIVDNCKKGLGYENYNAVPPLYTGNFMPPIPDLSFTGLDKFVNKPVVENCKAKSSEEEPKIVKKNDDGPTIKKWVSDNEKEDVSQPKIEKKMDQGVIDSRCLRRMTQNMSYLTDYKKIDVGYVGFGGNPKGGKITRKGTIKTGNLDFENVYFVKELKFNLFSVSQMFDKNGVLSNDTECIVLSPNFKLIDESQVLLRVPRKNNMYSVDLKNIVPKGGLTFLFAKATSDESKIWHRRLGHLNFKTMNKLVKENLVRVTKDETSGILKSFITRIENLVDHMVKVIKCDNRTEFQNRKINQFCEIKGILRQFSVARTPQQNRVSKRRNMTLIEAARTMLDDSKLSTTFLAEAVNTACYVQNRVLVVKPHDKTSYKLFHGRTPTLSFMRPFGCPVTILNTIDHLGKFDGKADEGFFVGYSLNSKAFRAFNSRTRIVEENLHIRFSESTPNVVGSGPDWLFDTNALTRTMNYGPIVACTQSNGFADPKSSHDDGSKPSRDDRKKVDEDPRKEIKCKDQEKEDNVNNTNNVNTAGNVNTVSSTVNVAGTNEDNELPFNPNMFVLEDVSIFNFLSDDKDDDHPLDQVIGDLQSAIQTRKMTKNLEEDGFKDPSWTEAMHEELLQFKLQEVWTLVDLPNEKRAIGTKWVFRNKKDKREIMIRNKARLVAQGYTQEEGIDYDELS